MVGKCYRDFAKHWKVQQFEWDSSDGGQLIPRWFLCKASEDWSRNVLGNISDKKMIATLKKRPSGIPDEAEEFRQRLQSVNDYVFSQVVSYA